MTTVCIFVMFDQILLPQKWMINKKGYTILRLSPTQVVITVSHGYSIYYKQTIVELTAAVCYNPLVHIILPYYTVWAMQVQCYDATFTTVYPNKITQTISFKYTKLFPVNSTNKQPITSLQFVQLQNWNRSYREGCGIPHPRKPTARIVDHRLATSHRSTNRRTSPTNWLQIFIEKVAQGLVDFIFCYYYYCIIKPPSQTQWWGFFQSPRK